VKRVREDDSKTFPVAFLRENECAPYGAYLFSREIFMSNYFFYLISMTKKDKEYVEYCIATDPHIFYSWCKWLKARSKVLELDKYECQICRNKYHRYRKANTVHHVNHLKDRPELALSIYYADPATHTRKRQLISLCHDCHEEVHGWRSKDGHAIVPLTEERWD